MTDFNDCGTNEHIKFGFQGHKIEIFDGGVRRITENGFWSNWKLEPIFSVFLGHPENNFCQKWVFLGDFAPRLEGVKRFCIAGIARNWLQINIQRLGTTCYRRGFMWRSFRTNFSLRLK